MEELKREKKEEAAMTCTIPPIPGQTKLVPADRPGDQRDHPGGADGPRIGLSRGTSVIICVIRVQFSNGMQTSADNLDQ